MGLRICNWLSLRVKILSSRRHPQVYGREGRKETYCRRLSIRIRSHHMILMTIKASLFSLFQQPEQKKEQLKPGIGFHGVCDWCSILFRKNKHMLCYNRVHRRPRKRVRVRRPFEASDSRAPVVIHVVLQVYSTYCIFYEGGVRWVQHIPRVIYFFQGSSVGMVRRTGNYSYHS